MTFLADLGFFVADMVAAVHEKTRVVGVKDGVPCEVRTEFATLHAPNVICATHTPLGARLPNGPP